MRQVVRIAKGRHQGEPKSSSMYGSMVTSVGEPSRANEAIGPEQSACPVRYRQARYELRIQWYPPRDPTSCDRDRLPQALHYFYCIGLDFEQLIPV